MDLGALRLRRTRRFGALDWRNGTPDLCKVGESKGLIL